jgi:peptidoglycan/LPS O-acetylase OafA/YrhL
MNGATQPRYFFDALGSLRGIAALVVVFHHIGLHHEVFYVNLVRNGYLMVDFFFVLSGFIICHSYGKEISNRLDVERFMWLRFGRVYPLHFFFLLVFIGFGSLELIHELITGDVGEGRFIDHFAFSQLLTTSLLLHSLGFHEFIAFNGPSWSISVEFYTYLLFAITVLIARTRASLVAASILLIVFSTLLIVSVGKTNLNIVVDYAIFRGIAGFYIGVLTYESFVALRERIDGIEENRFVTVMFPITISAIVIAFLALKKSGYSDFCFPLLVAPLILTLALAPHGVVCRVLNHRVLAWLGEVSYSVYMAHAAVVLVLSRLFNEVLGSLPSAIEGVEKPLHEASTPIGALFGCVAIGTTLFVAHVTFHWIEFPLRGKSRELAKRWFQE